jgi:hypothetical protein
MRSPSKTLIKRVLFMVVTTFVVYLGTSLFLDEVIHMPRGSSRDGTLVGITGMGYLFVRIWLHQKSKRAHPT